MGICDEMFYFFVVKLNHEAGEVILLKQKVLLFFNMSILNH